MVELSQKQWQKIDVASRIFLALTIIVGIGYAGDTAIKIKNLESQVKNGNCSYLLETGYVKRYNADGEIVEPGENKAEVRNGTLKIRPKP